VAESGYQLPAPKSTYFRQLPAKADVMSVLPFTAAPVLPPLLFEPYSRISPPDKEFELASGVAAALIIHAAGYPPAARPHGRRGQRRLAASSGTLKIARAVPI
jgi:hypothetical protein